MLSCPLLLYVSLLRPACLLTSAYHDGELVGAVACRLELHGNAAKLYIITLGVLAPFRGMRVGMHTVCILQR